MRRARIIRAVGTDHYVCCSRQDHAILEAEYQKNPRPDKATRASIVERVSMTEKEVQVRVEAASPRSTFTIL